MEFVCEKKKLQNGLSLVERIVTTRSTLPIIGNILLEVDKKGLKISANNLEIGIELGVEAKVVKGGSILLPAKTLVNLVSKLPNTKIGFKIKEEGRISISYDQSSFSVHTLPPDEFPALPKVKEGKSFELDPNLFSSMIRQTIFSVSNSEDKYILTGVLLEVGKGSSTNLKMVSTDGYRLAKREEKVKSAKGGQVSVVVPAKALQELLRILDQGSEDLELKTVVAADQISFKFGDVYLVSRIIQGQFPDYNQVIPKKGTIKIALLAKPFLEACERAAVIAQGSANVVRFDIISGKLHLSASTPDVGTVDEVLEAEIHGKEKLQIAFNIRLMIDVLKVLESEKVLIEFGENLGPGVVRPENGDLVYIVMPIRTQGTA